MFFATLPDTSPTSARGLAHIIIIGLVMLSAIGSVLILALQGTDIPDVFQLIITGGIFYLFGVNAAAPRQKS